jgi:phosphoribosylamine---glycine ligase
MKILIIGNGGREHALLLKLREDAPDAEFFITRGNGGTRGLATPLPLDPATRPRSPRGRAERHRLAVCGPEGPLAEGIADHLHAARRAALRADARRGEHRGVEGVRQGADEEGRRADRRVRHVHRLRPRGAFIREHGAPIVVKASGLAAGKGAVVCETVDEALDTPRHADRRDFGEAGAQIVVEEFLRARSCRSSR